MKRYISSFSYENLYCYTGKLTGNINLLLYQDLNYYGKFYIMDKDWNHILNKDLGYRDSRKVEKAMFNFKFIDIEEFKKDIYVQKSLF